MPPLNQVGKRLSQKNLLKCHPITIGMTFFVTYDTTAFAADDEGIEKLLKK